MTNVLVLAAEDPEGEAPLRARKLRVERIETVRKAQQDVGLAGCSQF